MEHGYARVQIKISKRKGNKGERKRKKKLKKAAEPIFKRNKCYSSIHRCVIELSRHVVSFQQ